MHHWSRLLGFLILATWTLCQKKIHVIVSMQRTFIQLSDSVVPTVLPPMAGHVIICQINNPTDQAMPSLAHPMACASHLEAKG